MRRILTEEDKNENVKDSKLGDVFGKEEDIISRVPSDQLVSNSLVGLEIEAINIPNQMWDINYFKWWKVVEDGSVRGGAEYVLKQPLSGLDLISAIEEVNEKLKNNRIRFDYQTSLHVHIDSRDINLTQFQNIVCLYTLFEPLLFTVCGESRKDNIFCLSVGHAPTNFIDTIKGIQNTFSPDDFFSLRQSINSCPRYSALNVSSLNTFGSLEFRGHRGTKEKDAILNWVNILLCLKEYALTHDNIEELLDAISLEGFHHVVNKLFKGFIQWDNATETELWKNLRLVHQLINYNNIEYNSSKFLYKFIDSRFKSLSYQYCKNKQKGKGKELDKEDKSYFKEIHEQEKSNIEFKAGIVTNKIKSKLSRKNVPSYFDPGQLVGRSRIDDMQRRQMEDIQRLRSSIYSRETFNTTPPYPPIPAGPAELGTQVWGEIEEIIDEDNNEGETW